MASIDELSPTDFTWEKYESDFGGRLGIDFMHTLDNKVMDREIKRRCVGWCPGEDLTIRPRSDMVAVMLEDDDFEQFWFHYPKVFFSRILQDV